MPGFDQPPPPLLFLSHAGIDTEAARALKQRIEAAPEAQEHGLRVWFDKDDLRAGEPWQAQIEEAIQRRSTAFAVYVGSRGVVNWVDVEVQLALGRAVTDCSYRFIPVLAPQAPGPEALPGFVALYQGVADVEGRPDQFTKLVDYLPRRRVVGISKLARVIEVFAKRLQIQEKMTAQIANTINEVLQPEGVAVVIEGEHQCM